jgi:uncharacterized protein YdbL (DUF1318 family)
MKTRFLPLWSVMLLFAAVCATAALRAEDLGAVKARMSERLSQLDQLKSSGEVGENNRGLVEVRGGGGDAASVVREENRDRQVVYAAIAQQTGSSADAVGRARARQIAAASRPGVWLQKDDGSWYRK